MDSFALKTFAEIAKTGSFSETAEQLHLTQPAISKRISALEAQLECKLFDRVGRRVQLTEAGRVLLPHANKILDQLERAGQEIQDLSGEVGGLLHIATSHHIGLHRMPTLLQSYADRYREVVLDIDFIDSEKAYEKVLHAEAELAIITLSPKPQPPIVQHKLWTDRLVFVANQQHPLFNEEEITLEQLSQHRGILPGLNTYTGQIVSSLFAERQLKLNSSMATNYLETIKMMVSIGLGWSVVPASMLDEEIKPLPLADINISRDLGYIYHQERSLSNAAKAFIELLSRQHNAS
ncbi:DNA-binding transcriptional LysR family regulator [Sinobacterium caligoides]|uniref:DNA-binding transcriptional LysR family regulator n=1 Tax=Sinobacterium caligoides TaxID=933926 RepID=A0A3N2DKV4_9GAMM|nr:LysR family transcriptional regulator [Sinobacterium caligoides]ROR99974.1 DNA-binding transcriptional LysR family regulator [Sinobacterium caligoides]